jgi:dolichol-phosphate mannosyltransferase
MFSWIGLSQTGVPYTRQERFAGETKYPLRKMLRFAMSGVISFSSVPLRAALNIGFVVSFLAFVLGIWSLVVKIGGFYNVPGWTSTILVVSFLGGIQLVVLGVIGEYIGSIHDEVKGRPLYVVGELAGFDGVPSLPPRAVVVPRSPITPATARRSTATKPAPSSSG